MESQTDKMLTLKKLITLISYPQKQRLCHGDEIAVVFQGASKGAAGMSMFLFEML